MFVGYPNAPLVKIVLEHLQRLARLEPLLVHLVKMGIVANSNLDFVGRPVIRICYNTQVGPVRKPYNINLAESKHQQKVILKVLDYT